MEKSKDQCFYDLSEPDKLFWQSRTLASLCGMPAYILTSAGEICQHEISFFRCGINPCSQSLLAGMAHYLPGVSAKAAELWVNGGSGLSALERERMRQIEREGRERGEVASQKCNSSAKGRHRKQMRPRFFLTFLMVHHREAAIYFALPAVWSRTKRKPQHSLSWSRGAVARKLEYSCRFMNEWR